MEKKKDTYLPPSVEVHRGIVTSTSLLIKSIVIDSDTEVDDEAAKEYADFDLWGNLWDDVWEPFGHEEPPRCF